MSAVEALAEVISTHVFLPTTVVCSCGRWHWRDEPHQDHVSAAVVAAIRSMPAEQVAELIGGSVERDGRTRYKDNVFVGRERVNGPWLPLGVSPETNGEQK